MMARWANMLKLPREIKARSLLFDEVYFCHERRSSNKEAHNIARRSIYDVIGRYVWLLAPPSGVCIPDVISVE